MALSDLQTWAEIHPRFFFLTIISNLHINIRLRITKFFFIKHFLAIIMNDKFLPKLSQNVLEILNDENIMVFNVEVGNDPYVKIFRAHMVILNYRSSYLRRILSTNKKKNDGTLTNIKLPSILPATFQIILR